MCRRRALEFGIFTSLANSGYSLYANVNVLIAPEVLLAISGQLCCISDKDGKSRRETPANAIRGS